MVRRVCCAAAVAGLVAIAWTSGARAESKRLREAQRAHQMSEWDRARHLAEAALSEEELTPAERALAHRLLGDIHAAYGREELARDEYLRVLGLTPDWRPGGDASPKIRSAFARAKREYDQAVAETSRSDGDTAPAGTQTGAGTGAETETATLDATAPPEAASPWYEQSWVWITAGGAVAVAVGVALAVVLSRPGPPDGDYFEELR